EVPWTDAYDRAQRTMAVVGKVLARLHGVITEEIDSFAHLGNAVGKRLAAFARHQAYQWLDIGFHQVGAALQSSRTLGHGRGLPDGARSQRGIDSKLYVFGGGDLYVANDIAMIR